MAERKKDIIDVITDGVAEAIRSLLLPERPPQRDSTEDREGVRSARPSDVRGREAESERAERAAQRERLHEDRLRIARDQRDAVTVQRDNLRRANDQLRSSLEAAKQNVLKSFTYVQPQQKRIARGGTAETVELTAVRNEKLTGDTLVIATNSSGKLCTFGVGEWLDLPDAS